MKELSIADIKGIKTLEDALVVIEELVRLNRQLFEENQKLRKEIDKLKKQAKPPHFTSKTVTNHAASKIANKRNKGQKKWTKTAKKNKIEIDQEVELAGIEICTCGCDQFTILRSREKIVQDIQIRRNNTKYFGVDKRCNNCDEIYHMPIPQDIEGQEFGSELRTWVSMWKFHNRQTEPLIHSMLTSMGIRISTGQISKIIIDNSRKLIPSYSHLRVWGIKLSKYIHTDATGSKRFMRKSQKVVHQHLQFVGHHLLSLFKITRKYNSIQLAFKVLGKRGMSKAMISDDHSANGKKLPVKIKQLCWLHEIRHYLKLLPVIAKNRQWLEKILDDFWKLYDLAKQYKKQPSIGKRLEIMEKYYQMTGYKTEYPELDKRLKLTRKKSKRMLAFLSHPYLPIENNLAERDLRPAVIMRKISGMTRSEIGDRSFERHLSVIQTAKKQNLDIFQTLHGLLNGQLSPFVLTAKTITL